MGTVNLSSSGNAHNLTTSDGSLSDGMYKVIQLEGATEACTITIVPPNAQKIYFVKNGSGHTVTFNQGSGGTVGNGRAITIANGDSAIIYANGAGTPKVIDITKELSAKNIITPTSVTNVKFNIGGTEILQVENASNDVVIKPIVDEKDIIFQQRDGTEVARIEDNGTFNIVTDKLAINATAVTTTANELNLLDGDTAVGSSITVADTDGIIVNDGGTTKTVPASDIRQYSMPTGAVIPFAGKNDQIPAGFLVCDGSAVSRTTYSALFTALGTTYGSGDNATTFNLPDLRGRVVAGQDDMGGVSANRVTTPESGINGDFLGGTGGSESVELQLDEMPSHNHTFSDTDTLSNIAIPRPLVIELAANSVNAEGSAVRVDSGSKTVSISGTTNSKGSGNTHNNMQPTIILNYLIRT